MTLTNPSSKPWIFDQTQEDLKTFCKQHQVPSFVPSQITKWLYSHLLFDPLAYTNLSKSFRQILADSFSFDLWTHYDVLDSSDGSAKFLIYLQDGSLIEMVCMPFEGRTTVCVSSQAGCKYGCRFCQTGRLGFRRHLSQGEILMQLILAQRWLREKQLKPITNVVFMGMGEPLDNWESLKNTLPFLLDPHAWGLTPRKVTVSTVGLVPRIAELGRLFPVSLAISLHAACDDIRSKMMPVNKLYPLKELKEVLKSYPYHPRYGITFEYILIEGVNDSIEHARKLVSFLSGIKAKVNLIPMNPYPGMNWKAPSPEVIQHFQSYLWSKKIPAPVRYSRAQDVSGACGQLAAKAQDELHLKPTQSRYFQALREQSRQSASI